MPLLKRSKEQYKIELDDWDVTHCIDNICSGEATDEELEDAEKAIKDELTTAFEGMLRDMQFIIVPTDLPVIELHYNKEQFCPFSLGDFPKWEITPQELAQEMNVYEDPKEAFQLTRKAWDDLFAETERLLAEKQVMGATVGES